MQSVTPSVTVAPHKGAVAAGGRGLTAWLIDLDAPGAGTSAALDVAERARAASFVRPQDGARFAASRAALRRILARYLAIEPHDVTFRVGPQGRPEIAGDDVRFSLARSGGLALIAVSREPVGADLERIQPRPGLADLAAARFPAREAARVAAGCCGAPPLSFYRHWVAKEAYLKAVGLGLAGLRDAELVCGARPTILFAGLPAVTWPVSVSGVPAGYIAALAGRIPATSWRWLRTDRPVTPARPAGWCR
jgi:4'-phosphopantetheinyl transferase